ncbi:PhoH family protein [Arsenicicoccus dermatophilus]|uniref:PhoH family protein n=1 Tax=Arsenicicoccus dermatophilus TaxID=1076331 RepID=UPI001F4CCEF4|nr:PhoH family protein [Arsenicicoccus dermatophilus]MCH8612795.1 PhoH family protein [Arsenicicoccus dermatophilus]
MTDHTPALRQALAGLEPATTPPDASSREAWQHTIVIPPSVPMLSLLGPNDELLRTVERAFPQLQIHVRGNQIRLEGPSSDAAIVEDLVGELLAVVEQGSPINKDAVERSIAMIRSQASVRPADVLTTNIISARGRTIRPKTLGQKQYVDAIDSHTIVFGIGPAGTGKTYLAMAKAVAALQAKEVTRIILTRPAVEAGERLGFLPGTLTDKIDPYLRPLYDALHDMLDPEMIPRLMAGGTIEVAPLAYMRGRTLNDAFIILDEAQNTSPEQMKMFLTRLGFGSRIVVTGDVTQVDLPGGTESGLRVVRDILDGVEDIHFAELTPQDVVRHRLVGEIVAAYGEWDEAQHARTEAREGRGLPRHRDEPRRHTDQEQGRHR